MRLPTPALPNLRYFEPYTGQPMDQVHQADVCIYGGTSAGVAAAVQAARMGKKAVIAEFGRHLGGLSSGGLGATDIGNKAAIGGISRSFYRALGKHYAAQGVYAPKPPAGQREGMTAGATLPAVRPADSAPDARLAAAMKPDAINADEMWTFEPHVAEGVFNTWVKEHNVPVHFDHRLAGVEKSGGRIEAIRFDNGVTIRAKVFIDATYEGDLLAKAGVSYHVGREANSVYRETLNGVHFGHPGHNFKAWVDPYRTPGDPSSGLLPGVQGLSPGFQGQGDRCVQAYNFRLCLTNRPDIRVPFPRPAEFEPLRYEILLRYIEAGVWDAFRLTKMMPNGKTDTNNFGAVSTDNIGLNYAWPDGDYLARERIFQDHVDYDLGLFYFLCHDPRLPAAVRDEMNQWGLCKDEFTATGGWPHQLYVREARRMVGPVVMTEHHCRKYARVSDPVGLAAYTMDSHNCRRLVLDGRCINEGNVEVPPTAPYEISYQAITPKADECTNLLVPVCLSSSHIAYGSIRMEPVFMVLGQSAATAAALALDDGGAVQQVPYARLRARLEQDQQILEWKG